MKKYFNYKSSGINWIGNIPNHWSISKIKYNDEVIMGQSPNSDDCNTEMIGLPFLQGNAEFGRIHPIPENWCLIPNKIALENDVLLSVRAPIGAINIADQQIGIGRGLCAIRQNKSYYKYLYYFLQLAKEELISLGTGSTFTAISTDDVKNLSYLEIPFEEQLAIANYLDTKILEFDTLILNKERLIDLLKEELNAVINHAITKGLNSKVKLKPSGVEWIGNIPEHWQTKRIRFLFKIVKRIAGELGFDVLSVTQKGIRLKDIKSGIGQLSLDYSKYQIVNSGDFIMNHMDLLTGYVDISKYKGVTSPDYRVFYLQHKDSLDEYFLFHFQNCYRNKIFYPLGQGSAQFGRWRLPTINFNNFILPVPPKNEQTDICKFIKLKVTEIESVILKTEKEIELLKEYKTGLISEVVTGKVDVREEVLC